MPQMTAEKANLAKKMPFTLDFVSEKSLTLPLPLREI
jgi:hypothetical protein